MTEGTSRRRKPHRARGISSISARLTLLVAFSSALPLAFVGGLSIMLTRYSFERTALSQIVDALEGAHSIVAEYHSLVSLGVMTEQRALSFIRRLFLGDLVEVSINAVDAADAEAWFMEQSGYRPEGAPAPYGLPERFPVQMEGDRAVMRDFLAVLSFKQAIDAMPLDRQAWLVNGPRAMRLTFNLGNAAVRIRESGYVFAITGSEPGSNHPVYELFHPTLTMVDVAKITNSLGEQVGLMISQRQGKAAAGLPPGYLRYEYDWVNDGEPRERRKITLLRYYEPWNLVLAAGLYEDEYFSPLAGIAWAVLAGLAFFGVFFLILARAVARSLIEKRVEELGAAFARTDVGNHPDDFPVHWQDEFGDIARAAAAMTRALKERESQIRLTQKLELAGTLAAGMAHDMNNVLGAMLGGVSLIKADVAEGRMPALEELSSALALVESSGRKASDMIRRLLVFSGGREEPFKNLNLVEVVDAAVILAVKSCPPEVAVNWDRPTGVYPVQGDFLRLEQALLNAIINARDAVTIMHHSGESKGGSVSVFIEPAPADHGNHVWRIVVQDDGVGMTEDVLQRAFDPFFSTKEESGGTGLGHAMVLHIARNHGGDVQLESSPGRGTTLTMVLPGSA
ncbi:MAG: ATP-binding protein [Spirochaetia bacterium]|nr:ATP-binding protein [Spirochaetia bacterium]